MRLIDFSFNDYVLNRTGEISSPIRAGMGGCPVKMSESRSGTQKISRDNRDPVLPPPIGKELKAMKKVSFDNLLNLSEGNEADSDEPKVEPHQLFMAQRYSQLQLALFLTFLIPTGKIITFFNQT